MELIHEKFGTIRAIEKDATYWFCAKDVCDALDYNDVESALRKLDDDEKGTEILRTPGGPQEMLVINESGLYTLIIRSSKPQARAFRRWVTADVLPTLRRTGRYEMRKAIREEQKNNHKALCELLKEMKKHLTYTDETVIARKLGIDQSRVSGVINGRLKDISIMRELYERAILNAKHEKFFYSREGCTAAVEFLMEKRMDDIAQLSSSSKS